MLTRMSKLRPAVSSRAHAHVYVEDGILYFDVPRMRAGTPFEGTWDGTYQVNAGMLKRYLRVLPKDDPVVISIDGCFLKIGTSGIGCTKIWR